MEKKITTELIVVRHGETIWNEKGLIQGHLDTDLSPLGIRQAEAIAERLTEEKVTAIYSSDLKRSYKTAEYLAAKTEHKIIADSRLRERSLGIFQGLSMDEVKRKYPDEFNLYETAGPDYVVPEGESRRQQFERAIECIKEIVGRHAGGRIVVVTHGGVLNGLFRYVFDIPISVPTRFKLFNASINTFSIENGTWLLSTWGDVSHLQDIGVSVKWIDGD
ncbi:MAG: histidine phosphatase family protein [Syntrophales bacterium]|nr:histidine phosphatase family protein [Syntrophales bacterium]